MKKIAILAMTAALTLAACATQKHTQQDASSAISAAEQELSRAKKVNYVWRDTGKLIKKAKAAAKEGEFDKAIKLANKAKMQSTVAMRQHAENKNSGPRF